MGLERRKEMDRQLALVRHFDYLGARRGRQPGQGLHRREQDDARFQRRKNHRQDGAQGCPEWSHYVERLPRARSESAAEGYVVSRYGTGTKANALRRFLDVDRLP